MARTAVTPAQGVRMGGVAPTSTTINSTLVTNGVTIANCKVGKLVLRIANSDTNAHSVIIRASDGGSQAILAGQGDLTIALPLSATTQVTDLDSARFVNKDGSLSIDFGSGTTGT